MSTDLAQRMRSLRGEQLFEIVYSRPEDGIVPEAIDAARAELAARNLDEAETQELRGQLLERQQDDETRATRHLPGPAVVAFGFFGLTLIGTFIIIALFVRGRRQMAIDAIYATLVGMMLGLGVALLAFWLLG